MRSLRFLLALAAFAALSASVPPAGASQDSPKPAQSKNLSGARDFDFLVGDWQVHHRRLKERLAGSQEWIEFDGTLSNRPLLEGLGNVGDNLFRMPAGDVRGVGFRAYDPGSGKWASWWLDGRNPLGKLDPPMQGSFADGIGTFQAEDTFREKPIVIRVVWSKITPTSARWEQAFSPDGGKTWETNWISEFRRVK